MIAIPPPVLRPPFDITRASHVVLTVRDLAASRAFYVDTLGFVVSDEDVDTLYLRGIEEVCHHSLVLWRAGSAACAAIGMRARTADDIAAAVDHLRGAGLSAARVARAFQHATLLLHDPAGVPLELCAAMETRPRMLMQFEAHHGGCPLRLDHVQVLVPDVAAQMRFYMAAGFRLSEYIVSDDEAELLFAFLQRKGNPHDIVFARGEGPRLHHVAFMVPEVHHLMFVCDLCARNGFGAAVEYGPGRHYGPGYARFVYLRDPDGHRIELFNTHYQTIDLEEEPARWRLADLYSTRWGPRPPASWLGEATGFAAA